MPKKFFRSSRGLYKTVVIVTIVLCFASLLLIISSSFGKNEEVNSSQVQGDADSSSGSTLFPLISAEDVSVSAPQVSARSAILIEAETGSVIWSKNPDQRLPMASTTKIMTALVALENCDVSKTVQVAEEATGIEGSSIYLYPNEKLTMEELLYAMLLESANDAAAAIAIEIGGDIQTFSEMMNQKASKLGLENTHFTNPHGLDDEEHYTTARELAIIAAEAMRNPTFKTIVSTYKKTIPLNDTEGVRLLINHNKLLKAYEGSCGIKTGYTKKSGRCLVSSAERDGVKLIAVTLNAPNDWSDHKQMLDFGFSLYESRTLCESGGFSYTMPVISGLEEYVILENRTPVSIILPRGSGEIECTVELPSFVWADVTAGDKIGTLIYSLDGQVVAECDIIAKYSVEKITYKKSLWQRLFSCFAQ